MAHPQLQDTAPTRRTAALADRLRELYAPVADDLLEIERVLADELRSHAPFVATLLERVQLYRGKRLRPALLLLVGQACGGVRPAHHVLGAVVEMIHAATLVHDDLIDDAGERRHVTTIHAEWGAEASVLLGDYLFTHAFHLAASLETAEACRSIGRATNRVCEGELRQVAQRGVFELSEEEYFDILDGKTAELIACACSLGARYADAAPAVVESMDAFGRELGIAFQIVDDLLDLEGDPDQTGKPVGSDLAQQEPTLPLIRFRAVAPPQLVARCRALFEEDVPNRRARVLACLQETDAISYTRRKAESLVASARKRLGCLPPGPATELLDRLTAFVLVRSA